MAALCKESEGAAHTPVETLFTFVIIKSLKAMRQWLRACFGQASNHRYCKYYTLDLLWVHPDKIWQTQTKTGERRYKLG